MERAIASRPPEPAFERVGWSSRLSLRQRILAVNVFALAVLAGSVVYLDSYRTRIIDERVAQITLEAKLVSIAVVRTTQPAREELLRALNPDPLMRVRIARNGQLLADSWANRERRWSIEQPLAESWERTAARWLDIALDFVAGSKPPETFERFVPPREWPSGRGWKIARDRTFVVWAAVTTPDGAVVLAERNARDIRRLIRAERTRLGVIVLAVALMSVLLSLFLARTIAEPLRRLAVAAQRVRHGRDREVNVPRLPERSDEIGLLARSVSDMTQTLRARMDAVEAFAADVAHELKNPLASLSSATQALRITDQPEAVAQLRAIVDQDIVRLNRLIGDISDLSRIDAQLARTRFQPVDIGKLIEKLIADRGLRGFNDDIEIAFARPRANTAIVSGDPAQLERVFENLFANAASFSPPSGVVRIAATRTGEAVLVIVEDDGPGIPPSARETIFERFHSDRPAEEPFGEHSGLGLSIARTIIEGHGGSIEAQSRDQGRQGARFEIRIPAFNGRML